MDYELNKLEKFLRETAIPIVRKRNLTFLGILKQPHYENAWSKIYAFFFDTKAEHNLDDLFIQSLIQLISENTDEEYQFNSSFDINTEYGTNKNGRIDLLLSNENEAIIIENKVYHYLNNDLHDYWNSVTQKKKQGIILSLQKVRKCNIDHDNFIGISHFELLHRVLSNLPNYFSNANDKFIVFLKDFYQNILNLTNPMDKNIIEFFLKNRNKINSIREIRDDYFRYVVSEVEKAIENIDEKLELSGKQYEDYRYYFCPNQGNLMISIVFRDLFTEKQELLINVELKNELIEEVAKDKVKCIVFEEDELTILHRTGFYATKSTWFHLAIQSLKPNENNIMNLGDFISKAINSGPILSIYRKLKIALVDDE